jgi:hypothetical protein
VPTEVLTIGPVAAITDNTIRALPARAVRLFVTFSTATSVDVSNASDMSNPQNLLPAAFATGGVDVAAQFIRVNGGNATVRCAAR